MSATVTLEEKRAPGHDDDKGGAVAASPLPAGGLLDVIRAKQEATGALDAGRQIVRSALKAVLEAAPWVPTPNGMQDFEIVVVDEKAQLEAIGQLPVEMPAEGTEAWSSTDAWSSPGAWNPTADATSRLTFLGRSVADVQALLVVLYDGERRPAGSEGDTPGLMGLGCVLENMWLMSTSLGIGMHVLTVFNNGHVEQQLQRLLHIPTHSHIAFACSLGYPAAEAEERVRARRDLETFVHHNRYGRKGVLWSVLDL